MVGEQSAQTSGRVMVERGAQTFERDVVEQGAQTELGFAAMSVRDQLLTSFSEVAGGGSVASQNVTRLVWYWMESQGLGR